ncbi:ribosome-associated translation inhibitor RaiA [Candidatus Dependentiae bacterium]|nr:ribosome-associated translation inhibitor RaiA [Candidatus Dependentiae bacterium]
MNRRITFHEMDHSKPMENHINEKLNKIEELIKDPEWATPKYVELFLNAHPLHPHHEVELILKTPQFNLVTQDKGTEMYVVIDNVIDKMVRLLKKEKQRVLDKKQKVETEKNEFADDKYTL